jgi:ketosteroid isomerase-like protein
MMKTMVAAVLVMLAAPAVLAAQEGPPPAPAPLPSVQLPPELDRVLRDYERAWAANDEAALAALFTEDGMVMQPGRPPVRGRDAIRTVYANSGGALALRALAHAADGSVGWIIGAFTYEGAPPDAGKFILALRKGADGRWLIAADMDSPSLPPQRRAGPGDMVPSP